MSKNRLTIALLLLVGLGVLTLVTLNSRKADYAPAVASAKVTLPKIAEDKIDELELSSVENGKVRLVKKGDEWRVADPVDAKADQDAVKTAVKKIAELKLTGVAATKKENHERLEVTEAKGTHVIAKGDGKLLLDAYLGSYGSGNTMLRLKDKDEVASIEGSIRYAFRKSAKDFRDKTIIKFETGRVQSITFDGKNGHFEFTRNGDDWKQVLAKGQKKIDPLDVPKVRGIVGSASSMNATDFAAPGVTAEQAGLGDGAALVSLKLSGDPGPEVIRFRVGGQKDSNYYFQHEGDDTIYLVTAWIGARMQPKTDDLIKKDPPKTPPAAPTPTIQGGQGLDPALLQQLQQQLQQQGGNPHAGH